MKAVQAKTRIALKNILFATDFSAAAEAAMPFAIQVARRYGAKVYGVHVNSVIDYTAVTPGAWEALGEAAEKETIEDTQSLHKQLHGIEHEVLVAEGNTWDVVSGLIREKHIDLVVVGTRGRTGLGKVLLGSVAEQILRQAPCPVLTVGPHVTLEPEKAAEMHQILYATEMAAEFPAAAPYAISLAQENQAHLTLLHVIPGTNTGVVQPVQSAGSLERRLREFVPQGDELWCEPVCLVEEGEPAEKILEVAMRRNADLIVLGARPAKGLLGAGTHLKAGTAHKVLLHAKCPVLTVRG
jgi:nucleotide-binding universal stress UspA family protein